MKNKTYIDWFLAPGAGLTQEIVDAEDKQLNFWKEHFLSIASIKEVCTDLDQLKRTGNMNKYFCRKYQRPLKSAFLRRTSRKQSTSVRELSVC